MPWGGWSWETCDFNPRSPWGERPLATQCCTPRRIFQSTLPVGGATTRQSTQQPHNKNFNPRSPWGERLPMAARLSPYHVISIHAPRGGSDSASRKGKFKRLKHFNPRSPWGERLCIFKFQPECPRNFNPRSPWGERPHENLHQKSRATFQSTLPVGGATPHNTSGSRLQGISIHAPRGGSDAEYGYRDL